MPLEVLDLGLIEFTQAWEIQKKTFNLVKNDPHRSFLILCRHFPVITLGRLANKANILTNEAELLNKGIKVCQTERGGDVTYHGPGQITVYPVLYLGNFKKDIHLYLRLLENVAIDMLSDFGINASKCDDLTGVWVKKEKIASIGISVKNWITYHGMSINITNTDLERFLLIRPCGMDIQMTSLEKLLRQNVSMQTAKEKLLFNFNKILRKAYA